MRLQLSLIPLNPKTAVPINYNYPLSAAIYKIIGRAAPDYAQWLHDHGYVGPTERRMKLFTFSRLNIPKVRMEHGTLIAGDDRPWLLQIASPMEDEFVQNFVLGLFESQKLEIGGPRAVGRFLIESVEALPMPVFREEMRGKTLSPIVASTMRDYQGKLQPYYYRPTDAELPEAIRKNLLSKYEIVFGKACSVPEIQVQFDMDYYHRKQGKVTRLWRIKEGTPEETRVKSFEMPFKIRGNPELMRIAWECGLGDKNSLGFGMVALW
ncbi:MAG: CRISPR-associated endoribonuclease Cas6 [candidate division KSB1 bacterium]|nr:CRISPR-associated endoribonuclease Cas6 [candidate division KSB1 bacterium]